MSKQNNNLKTMRHSASHLLAAAVVEMFPEAKLGIGPAIENGFYYDFELPRTLIPEDLPLLEKKMKHLAKQNLKFEYFEKTIDEAINFLKEIKQDYKIELVKDLQTQGETTVNFYKNGNFVDLCKGPHVESTMKTGVFKLTSIAGAYWKGNEKNPMLQRIYGILFENKADLDAHLKFLAEAKKRDHRKLGKDLDLFSFHEEGPGFPFWHPKGTIIFDELVKYWKQIHQTAGYQEIRTPLILNEDLWHQSGHWDNYQENMYFTKIDERNFAIKPMNCPGGMLIYKANAHSYRDLPLRIGELGLVHRHELSGTLHGLFRVRSFTQDDAHIYCTPDQVEAEITKVIKLAEKIYHTFGFDFRVELSTRPKKSIGSDQIWELAENTLEKIIKESGIEFDINPGDGAFYGPKLDFHLTDTLGRGWQCGTVQLDFSMPERFELEYNDKDGKKHRPVMLHRVIFGSMERFIGILLEHFTGALPIWLSPLQARIIPVAESHQKYAEKVLEKLQKVGIRADLAESTESLGKRIRSAEVQKIPYMLVLGDKEVESKNVTVRDYKTKNQKPILIKNFLAKVQKEIQERSL